MASPNLARSAAAELAGLLDSPEIGQLIEELRATRWTGRPGYPIRTMVGLALAKSLYAIPTWTKTVALVREHWALQRALGCEGKPPSVYSAYRFAEKLRAHGEKLERCIDGVVEGLRSKLPSYGRDLSIDASDMPAYANGQRYVSKGGKERERFSDRDAIVGPSLRRLDPQGRWLLRLPPPRGRLLQHRPASRLGRGDGEGERIEDGRRIARHSKGSRCHGGDGSDGQGLRRRACL
jgi:Transposase domain (DUF772)